VRATALSMLRLALTAGRLGARGFGLYGAGVVLLGAGADLFGGVGPQGGFPGTPHDCP